MYKRVSLLSIFFGFVQWPFSWMVLASILCLFPVQDDFGAFMPDCWIFSVRYGSMLLSSYKRRNRHAPLAQSSSLRSGTDCTGRPAVYRGAGRLDVLDRHPFLQRRLFLLRILIRRHTKKPPHPGRLCLFCFFIFAWDNPANRHCR